MNSRSQPAPRRLAGAVFEWVLLPTTAQHDDLTTADMVAVTGPDGTRLGLVGFNDGEHWRVRLAVTPGNWHWQIGTARGLLTVAPEAASPSLSTPLRVSPDRRWLTDAAGRPFLFFADTAWAIVWKGTPEQWGQYLDQRAAQGFSVVQVNLLPWRWDLTDVEGNSPFMDGDPARPNPAYFRRFDQFCALAAERGLVICLMLVWGGPSETLPASHFSTAQATAFARYAVARYAAFPVLWSISGDGRYAEEVDKWETVGAAVEAADPYAHPTTNHLQPNMNWHFLFHASPWHDFHMLQTGHRRGALADIAALPAAYYRQRPVKPVINGEPWYEAHPSRDTADYGPVFTPAEVRYALWVSVLSGATMGHTYGSQGIWNWKRPGDDEQPLAGPQIGPTWDEALAHPGAAQCALAVALLRRLSWWRLEPCPERVELTPASADCQRQPAAARAPGECWLVYLPDGGQPILKGVEPAAWLARWVDPRTGAEHAIGLVEPDISHRWQAPAAPSGEDWVLLLTPRG